MNVEIKEPAHAVRVLEALVEQGEKIMEPLLFPWDYKFGPFYIDDEVRKREECWDGVTYPAPKEAYGYVRNISRIEVANGDFSLVEKGNGEFMASSTHLVPALVEGAKAVLKEHKEISSDAADWETLGGAERVVLSLAQAYAPRMVEAGMEVPK